MIPINNIGRVPEGVRSVFLKDLFSLYFLKKALRFSFLFPAIFLFFYLADLFFLDIINRWFSLSVVFFGVPVVISVVYFFVYYDFYRKYRGYLE